MFDGSVSMYKMIFERNLPMEMLLAGTVLRYKIIYKSTIPMYKTVYAGNISMHQIIFADYVQSYKNHIYRYCTDIQDTTLFVGAILT